MTDLMKDSSKQSHAEIHISPELLYDERITENICAVMKYRLLIFKS